MARNLMCRRPWTRLVPLSLVLAIASIAPSAKAAEPFENILPSDAVLFVNVNSVKELKANVKNTSGGELYRDPAMQPFVNKCKQEFAKVAAMVQQQTGLDVEELLNIPQGQIAFSLRLHPEDPEKEPYVQLLMDIGDNEGKVQELLSRLEGMAEQQGAQKREEAGLTILGKGEERKEFCYAIREGILVVGNDVEATSQTANGLSGDAAGEGIGANPRFKDFRNASDGKGGVEIFVDVNRIIQAVGSKSPQVAFPLQALGVTSFQYGGASISFARGKYDSEVHMLLRSRGPSTILQLLDFPAKPIKPEPWVPENTANYSSLNFDIDRFYQTLTALINTFNPGAMEMAKQQLAGPDPNNPLLDLESDLIGPLGDRITTIADMATSRDMPVNRVVIAWGLDDSAALKGLIQRVLALVPGGANALQTKTIAGSTVYFFPLGDLMEAQLPPDYPMGVPFGDVAFSVTNTHLMLTTHLQLLEQIMTYKGASLAENPNYQRIAEHYPSATSAISYANTQEQARSGWEMFKSGQVAEIARKAMEQNPEAQPFMEGFIGILDGSTLPEFDAVKKYMAPQGSYMVKDENGIRITAFSLKPE